MSETPIQPATPQAGTSSDAAGLDARLLTTEGLVKAYRGRCVVNGVSIHVTPGEIVGLMGPNGAGKTTTFNMVVDRTSVG